MTRTRTALSATIQRTGCRNHQINGGSSLSVGILSFLLLLLSTLCARSQGSTNDRGMLDIYSFGDDYYLEVDVLPGPTSNRSRALVLIRLTNDMLTFRKERNTDGSGERYRAFPTVYVEAENEEGVIVDYRSWSDTVVVDGFASTNSKELLVPVALELSLRPGRYVLTYSIDDGAPGRRFTRKTDPFVVRDFGSDGVTFGSPVFMIDTEPDGRSALAAGIDGNAPFGRQLQAFVSFSSNEPVNYLRYEILKSNGTDDRSMRSVKTGTIPVVHGLVLDSVSASGSHHQLKMSQNGGGDVWGGILDLDASALDPDVYVLQLMTESPAGSALDTFAFELRWVDMPFSLMDPTYAINALRPIATDDQIDALLKVKKEDRFTGLVEFWKQFDPTPETAYNEKMAVYYQRVDYARVNFVTFGQPDGTMTDRGKIYVLYGPPTSISRELDPDSEPRELWQYDNAVQRKFVFTDRKESGNYILVEYYDL